MGGLKSVPLDWDHPEYVAGRQFLELINAGPVATHTPPNPDEHVVKGGQTKESSRGKLEHPGQFATKEEIAPGERAFPRFMDLPLEIRDQIYGLEPWHRTWHVLSNKALPTQWHEVDPPRLNILQTSKQVYIEAFHHFYTDHTIAFDDPESLRDFLYSIGSKRRRQLRRIFFDFENEQAKEAFRLLKTYTNLTSVFFTLPCARAEGLQALREVRGLELVSVFALKHVDATVIAGTNYRLVTDDHACRACEGVPAETVSTELEQAMRRPRPKSHYPQDDQTDLLKSASFKSRRISESEALEDSFVYRRR